LYNYNKQSITKSDILHVIKSLKSKYITKGKYLNLFENKLKKQFGCKNSLVFSNGTMALFSISKCLNWGKKDTIIVSPMTFVAGANAVHDSGANIEFVDIDKYQNLDPDLLEKKIIKLKNIGKKISAVIATDYAGVPANWDKLIKLKKKYKFILINDNCHAIGSKYKNLKNYSTKYADLVVHSYHAVKNITSGEGGSILTNNKKFYNKLKNIREHGFLKNNNKLPWVYDLKYSSYNARLSELNCALGYSQIQRLNQIVKKRNLIAKKYDKIFSNIKGLEIPLVRKNDLCSYHLYPLKIDWKFFHIKKIDFFKIMKLKYKINLQVHYTPTYKFRLFKKKKKIDCPNTEDFFNKTFSIPLYINLKNSDINYISNSIINILMKKNKLNKI
jgi:dTDP-4-amino-4,6-dideoxygalactose transaminase